ncbi:MAG: transglutaminase domain-containing protein [Dehalococcoidia bacterium]|nr:transglutaminase domain-containing protein [Dehalococcoidia bacterium]
MKLRRVILISLAAICASIIPSYAIANPSENFYQNKGKVFDDWGLCRTHSTGEEGFFQVFSQTEFRPAIVFESLGENADRAYRLGQELAENYPDPDQRAEKVFAFARDKMRYDSDVSQFGFDEFAQNADEVVAAIEEDGFTYGDCEDYAVLLAVMYRGGDYRSAIALAPNHAAALVYLPGYKKANQSLSLDGEPGWVWAEATGGNNHLGWMPEQYMGAPLAAYEVTDESIAALEPPVNPPVTTVRQKGSNTGVQISPFFIVIAFMWILPLFRRRRRR